LKTVTLAQLESLAARAPQRAAIVHVPAGGPGGETGQSASTDVETRARAYLSTIPPAVAGQRGHDRTFYAANRLIRGFDLTPESAFPLLAEWNTRCDPPWSEHDLRRKLVQAAQQKGPRGFLLTATLPRGSSGSGGPAGGDTGGAGTSTDYNPAGQVIRFRNYTFEEIPDGERMKPILRGRPLPDIAEQLHRLTFGWPKRVGPSLFVLDANDRPLQLLTTEALFAWIGSVLAREYPSGADPVEWNGRAGPTKTEFRAYLEQNAEPWESVELHPHEPPISGAYYCPHPAAGGDGKALTEFVRMFSPDTPEDEDLIRAYVATLAWGGPAGQRPMWLFTAAEGDRKAGRGIGKSILASTVASIFGGSLEIKQTDDYEKIKSRLLSPEARSLRVIMLDNLKSLRFTWGDIEGLITSPTISGHELFKGEGRRPNHLSLVVTANAPSLNTDISDRAIIVKLTRPSFDATWFERLDDFVKENQWAIIGDALAMLREPSREVTEPSRWGPWQRDVLARVAPEPQVVQKLINARAGEVNVDAEEAAEVRAEIADLIRERLERVRELHLIGDQTVAEVWDALLGVRTDAGDATDPEHTVILITPAALEERVGKIVGKSGSHVSAMISALGVRGMKRTVRNGRSIWRWVGDAVSENVDAPTCVIAKDAVMTVGALDKRRR
jgi:hypothetical protein